MTKTSRLAKKLQTEKKTTRLGGMDRKATVLKNSLNSSKNSWVGDALS
jgi:hypothetical protein